MVVHFDLYFDKKKINMEIKIHSIYTHIYYSYYVDKPLDLTDKDQPFPTNFPSKLPAINIYVSLSSVGVSAWGDSFLLGALK